MPRTPIPYKCNHPACYNKTFKRSNALAAHIARFQHEYPAEHYLSHHGMIIVGRGAFVGQIRGHVMNIGNYGYPQMNAAQQNAVELGDEVAGIVDAPNEANEFDVVEVALEDRAGELDGDEDAVEVAVEDRVGELDGEVDAVKVEVKFEAVKIEREVDAVKVEAEFDAVKVEAEFEAVNIERGVDAVKIEGEEDTAKVEGEDQEVAAERDYSIHNFECQHLLGKGSFGKVSFLV
jgi:hypothetical protein